jgi:hypothetical protein
MLSAQETFTLNPYYTISSGNFYTLLRLYSQLMHIEYTVLYMYIHADPSAHRFYSEAITLSSGLLQLSFHASLRFHSKLLSELSFYPQIVPISNWYLSYNWQPINC